MRRSDFKEVKRFLLKNPGISTLAVAGLAIGIAANAVTFSVLDAIVLRSLPISDPAQLVVLKSLHRETGRSAYVSTPDYQDYEQMQEVFTGLAAYRPLTFMLRFGQRRVQVNGEAVSVNYFELLGVRARLGRELASTDETSTRGSLVVISHKLWKTLFQSDSGVIGQLLEVNGRALTIIGVAPSDFRGLSVGNPPDIWIPLLTLNDIMSAWLREGGLLDRRDSRNLLIVGRLKEDIPIARTEAAMQRHARRLEETYPETNSGWSITVHSLSGDRIPEARRGSAESFVAVLLIVGAFAMLAAACNVVTLVLQRMVVRRQELAVRLALGARRSDFMRQALIEVMSLFTIAFFLGIPLASAGITLFRALPLLSLESGSFDMRLDVRVIGLSAAVTLGSGAIFGILLGLRSSAVASQPSLRNRFVTARGRTNVQPWGTVTALQISTAVVLSIGAGLFIRTLSNLLRVDTGFRLEDVLLFSVDMNAVPQQFSELSAKNFYSEILAGVTELPMVRSAAWAGDVPFGTLELNTLFSLNEQVSAEHPDWRTVSANIVTPGYFQTLGIELVRGRDFSTRNNENASNVVIINEAMNMAFWPHLDAVGKRFWINARGGIKSVEIVGVARNVRQRFPSTVVEPSIYFPLAQRYFPLMTLHVSVDDDMDKASNAIRDYIAAANVGPLSVRMTTLMDVLHNSLGTQRIAAVLFGISGCLAVTIAFIGVFALTTYTVSQRSLEVGLRCALGARKQSVIILLVRQTMKPALVGLVAGVVVALALSRAVEGLLVGVARVDVTSYAAATVLIGLVASFAAYVGAIRAAGHEPMTALQRD